MTENEVLQALRTQGVASPDQAAAVVLETDGTLSILQQESSGPASTLANVVGTGAGRADAENRRA